MKKLLLISSFAMSAFLFVSCDKDKEHAGQPKAETTVNTQVVDAGCGMCTYDIDGVEGCETWVNIDNKKLKVTGIDHNTHKSGLCKSGKHSAKVSGEIKGSDFVAISLEVVKPSTGAGAHSDHDQEGHQH